MKDILTKNCIVCGKKFTKNPNVGLPEWFGCRRRPNGVRFCSRKCSNGWKKGKHYSPSTEFKKGQKAINPIKKGRHLSSKTQFKKGIKPWNKGTKGLMPEPWNKGLEWPEMQGDKHHNWKGGRTALRYRIRTTAKYKRWRTAVFKRDSYKCCSCGVNNNKLQAHHRNPFYKILEENCIQTLEDAKSCDALWDLDNGETLCITCHRQTDSYLVNQHTK